jgi:Flp pilus assembly protein TadB
VEREEIQAAIEARRELGPELEPHVIDSFVARIEQRLPKVPAQRANDDKILALTIISLVAAIPLTAIAITQSGLTALVVVWLGIVLVNLSYSRRR